MNWLELSSFELKVFLTNHPCIIKFALKSEGRTLRIVSYTNLNNFSCFRALLDFTWITNFDCADHSNASRNIESFFVMEFSVVVI